MNGQLKANSKVKYKPMKKNNWSIAGICLGIFSLFLYWIAPYLPVLGLLISIIGVTRYRELWTGLLLGIIGIIVNFLILSTVSSTGS